MMKCIAENCKNKQQLRDYQSVVSEFFLSILNNIQDSFIQENNLKLKLAVETFKFYEVSIIDSIFRVLDIKDSI